MKCLLCWLPYLRRTASILYTPTRFATFSKITLSLICFGSLYFLIGGLTAKEGASSREQRLMSLTGLFGLSYAGMDLFWHFQMRLFQSRAIAIGYYFAWHLLGGMALGMLLYVGFPKAAKRVVAQVLLTTSAISIVAFNAFAIVCHLASATLFLCLVNSLVIGVLIPSAVVFWFDSLETEQSVRQ